MRAGPTKIWVRFRARVRYDSDYPGADDLLIFDVNYDFDLLSR